LQDLLPHQILRKEFTDRDVGPRADLRINRIASAKEEVRQRPMFNRVSR
jgi:hypothetical protein